MEPPRSYSSNPSDCIPRIHHGRNPRFASLHRGFLTTSQQSKEAKNKYASVAFLICHLSSTKQNKFSKNNGLFQKRLDNTLDF